MNEKKARKKRVVSDETKISNKTRALLPINTLEVEIESYKEHLTFRKSKKNNKYTEQDGVRYVADVSDEMRQLQNTIQGIIYRKYKNMCNTKKYRGILKFYGKLNEQILKLENRKNLSDSDKTILSELKARKNGVGLLLEDMKIEYKVSKSFIVDEASKLKDITFKKVNSVMALKCADRVWLAMEKLMFDNAEKLKFKSEGQLPSLEGKQASRGIILKFDEKNDKFFVTFDRYKFNLKVTKGDLYLEETLNNIKEYIKNGNLIEKENMELFLLEKPVKSTYRVLYNRIVLKEIRGRLRLYIQIVYEGNAVPRRNKDGSFRHIYGEGDIGCDIGTQSVAIVSKESVILKNLAERSKKYLKFERGIRVLERAMDRSKRANNKVFFYDDGTFKKRSDRPKDVKWMTSKKYLKLKCKRKEIHRKAALSREYAINEDVNKLRSLGDRVIIEKMNFTGLQKRAKETTVNEKTGKFNKKKRYGKSIGNRCPGGFMAQIKRRFESSSGKYIEVNTWLFKASQYDHMLNDCNKKQLSKRWHEFSNGIKVQRDLYSAMLLYCSNESFDEPDNKKCVSFFDTFLKLHKECIDRIKVNRYRVLNSGIKV